LQGRKSLPDSGRHLVSTLVDRQSTIRPPTLPDTEGGRRKAEADPVLPQSECRTPHSSEGVVNSTAILEMLQSLSYPDAVLWIGSRLADGLAHAHERGILHRDIKPANILLTDEGQPMLLDFNLAHDTKLRASAAAAQVGGTLPFMAPEQLQA